MILLLLAGLYYLEQQDREQLGELVSVVYLAQKEGDRIPYEYEHDFDDPRPELSDEDGALYIDGGGYDVVDGWIHD